MLIYEHTTPTFLIWIGVIAAILVGGFSVWRWGRRTVRMYIISGLYVLFLLLLLWCLLMPGRKKTETKILKPRFVVMLDQSKSMVKIPEGEEIPTRWQRAQEIINMSWVAPVAAECEIDVYPFDQELGAQVVLDDVKGTEPNGQASLIRDCIRKATSRYGGLNVAGGLLLTDGIDTREALDDWASESRPFPIYTIQLEPDSIWTNEPDLRVETVQTPKRVTMGWETELKAVISGQGYPGQVNVQLFKDNKLLETYPTLVPVDGGSSQVQFDLAHPELGVYTYRVFVPPVPGESNTNDNEYAVSVTVIDAKNRLIYIDGAPRWESKYLKHVLQSSKQITPLIFLAGPDGKPITFGNVGSMTADMTEQQLSFFKVVIIGNLDAEEITPARAQNLIKYVEEGGSLVLLGGAKSWGLNGFASSPVRQLLPVKRYKPKPLEGEFQIVLTDEGQSHAAFVGDPDLWNNIPPILTVFPSAEPTRAAQVLVTAKTPEGDIPVVVAQRYAQGKVVAIFTDSLWKWRLHPQAKKANTYQRFWDQLVSWLLPEEEEMEKDKLILFADRESVVMGEQIKINARMGGDNSATAVDPRCTIKPPEAEEMIFSMLNEPVTTDSGKTYSGFSTTFTPALSGLHEVIAKVMVNGETVTSEPISFFVKPFSAEDLPKPVNVKVLRSIAQSSGGKFFTDANELNNELTALKFQSIEEEISEYQSLWNTWWLIVVMMAVATVAWVLRKLGNMP